MRKLARFTDSERVLHCFSCPSRSQNSLDAAGANRPVLSHFHRRKPRSIDPAAMCPACALAPAAARGGLALYELYRAASRAAAPAVLLWRRLQGLEHPTRWPERLGRPSAARPRPGSPLVWFHAVSLGEGMAALPVVRHCARLHPGLPVLLTTTTLSSL